MDAPIETCSVLVWVCTRYASYDIARSAPWVYAGLILISMAEVLKLDSTSATGPLRARAAVQPCDAEPARRGTGLYAGNRSRGH